MRTRMTNAEMRALVAQCADPDVAAAVAMLTSGLDEHPVTYEGDLWDGPCQCRDCLGYSDVEPAAGEAAS